MVQKGALSTLRGPSISTHSLVSHGEDEESELTGPRGEEERGRGRGGGVGGVRRRCGGLMQKKQRVATCTRWIISSGSHECSGHACTHAHTKKRKHSSLTSFEKNESLLQDKLTFTGGEIRVWKAGEEVRGHTCRTAAVLVCLLLLCIVSFDYCFQPELWP